MSPQTDTQSRTTTKQIQFIEVNSKFILVVERELAPVFCKVLVQKSFILIHYFLK